MCVGTGHFDADVGHGPMLKSEMTRTSRLWAVLVANLLLVGALVGVGVAAHSVGVWAEGVDYLADAAAIGVSLLAIALASRPPTVRRPKGYPRATRYAALVNAGWLVVLCLLVSAEAIRRLVGGVHHVDGLPILITSGIAALVMLAGALLLGGDDENDDLNVRAVFLDTAADAAAAAGVAVTGAVIYATGGVYWLDPAVGLVIAVVVGFQAARMVRRVRLSLAD